MTSVQLFGVENSQALARAEAVLQAVRVLHGEDALNVQTSTSADQAAFVESVRGLAARLGERGGADGEGESKAGGDGVGEGAELFAVANGTETIGWTAEDVQRWGQHFAPALRQAPVQMAPDGFEQSHDYDYDIIVVGGGSGGVSCARECAKQGARTAMLDFVSPSPHGSKWGLGGTCVNVGCIPKKLMHNAALLGELSEEAKSFGWEQMNRGDHSWEGLRSNVQDHIKSLNFGYRVDMRENNVTYVNKRGKFVDAHTLELTDKKGRVTQATAARFVVAVGGRPTPLDCPGGEHAITSDDLFSLENSPGKTCVVGASYVALECAGFLTGIGLDVTVLVRSILLRGFDRECADKIGEYMESTGTKIKMQVLPESVEKQADGRLLVKMNNGEEDVFDTVLVAIGRRADTAQLGVAELGVAQHERSGKLLCTNEQTSVPHIYAIGDVVHGAPELTPSAIQAGKLLAQRLWGGSTQAMDYRNIATTVFTPLEYGCVGLSEDDARAEYGDAAVDCYVSVFQPLEWTLSHHHEEHFTFCKVVVDKRSSNTRAQRVLGMHILAPNAGEITQGLGIAIRNNISYQDLMDTVGIHPTTGEEFTVVHTAKSSGADGKKSGC